MYKVTQLSWGRNKTMSVMRFHAVTLQLFCLTMVQTSLKIHTWVPYSKVQEGYIHGQVITDQSEVVNFPSPFYVKIDCCHVDVFLGCLKYVNFSVKSNEKLEKRQKLSIY